MGLVALFTGAIKTVQRFALPLKTVIRTCLSVTGLYLKGQ